MSEYLAEIEAALIKLFKALPVDELEQFEDVGGRIYLEGNEGGYIAKISYGVDTDAAQHSWIQHLPNIGTGGVGEERSTAEETRNLLLASAEGYACGLEEALRNLSELE